jgi:hypothetical protein
MRQFLPLFVWFTPSFPPFSPVFTAWHAHCFVRTNDHNKHMIRKAIFGLALFASALGTLKAEIGDTYEKSCERYGTPHHRTKKNQVVWNISDVFSVQATFQDDGGACDFIVYVKSNGNFDDDLLKALIGRNVMKTDAYTEYQANTKGTRIWRSWDGVGAMLDQIKVKKGSNVFALSVFSAPSMVRFYQEHPEVTTEKMAPPIETLPTI